MFFETLVGWVSLPGLANNLKAVVAQLVERQSSKLAVAGSSPVHCSKIMKMKISVRVDNDVNLDFSKPFEAYLTLLKKYTNLIEVNIDPREFHITDITEEITNTADCTSEFKALFTPKTKEEIAELRQRRIDLEL